MEKETIICFPFAGGSSHSYSRLFGSLRDVEVCSIELPGRASRFGEEKIVDINRMVDDIIQNKKHSFTGTYVLYGHSMGALLAYLVARRIVSDPRARPPVALLVSGAGGPSVPLSTTLHSDMGGDALMTELVRMGSIQPEIANDITLREYIEEIMRADLTALESYRHVPSAPLDIPITLLYGDMEDLTEEEINAWQLETIHPLNAMKFPGNHFFIFDHPKEISRIVVEHMGMVC